MSKQWKYNVPSIVLAMLSLVLISAYFFNFSPFPKFITCEDSDGYDPFTKGFKETLSGTQEEICDGGPGSNVVKEGWCIPSGMIKFYFKPNTTKLFILIGGNYTYEKVFCPSGCVDGACVHQCNNGMQDSDKIWGKTLSGYVMETKNESGEDCGGACDACPQNQICYDSDSTIANDENDKSFETKGTVYTSDDKGNLVPGDSDECAGNKKLVEYICNKEGPDFFIKECGCKDGACVTCTDTDEENIFVKGNVTFANKTNTDSCINNNAINESVCKTATEPSSVINECSIGTFCEEGACVPDLKCIDSDGEDVFIKGTVSGKEQPQDIIPQTYNDSCWSPATVLEWSCTPWSNETPVEVVGNNQIDCPKGALCEDGACVKQ